ncbi:MAG TPA: hypothetical protein VFQ53_00955 [Kofleriaceae bacterium]|nr:hypothetical protein [Kofleriaceae bacterium]
MRFAVLVLIVVACVRSEHPTLLHNEVPAHPVARPVQSRPAVTTVNEFELRVAVTCEYAGVRRTAATLVFLTPPTASTPAPFAEIAAADAWLLVSKDLMKAQQYREAAAVARQGLEKLGPEYRAPTVRDDTLADIAKGERLIAQGDALGGAWSLIDALRARIYMATVREEGRVLRDVPLDE